MPALDTAPAGFLSTEAARGARRQKLAAIDLFWQGIRDDIQAEHAHSWGEILAASVARIRVITDGVTVDEAGVLQGPDLCVHLAIQRLDAEWDLVRVLRLRLDHVYAMALEGVDELHAEQRQPFDFDLGATA